MLSQLCSEYFARSQVLIWPLVALGIFVTVFIAVSLRALARSHADVRYMAELPLRDTTEVTHHD